MIDLANKQAKKWESLDASDRIYPPSLEWWRASMEEREEGSEFPVWYMSSLERRVDDSPGERQVEKK